jgi:hypothetical protein
MNLVEELTPATVREVADRIAVAAGFEDLVYRESEIDALWSLADIARRDAVLAGSADAERWTEVLRLIGTAHDLIPDGRCVESAAILRQTLPLLSPPDPDAAGSGKI